MEYTTLIDLEWFIDNNGIINSKTQELVLSNYDYEVHIPLNKGMSGTYIEAQNQSKDKIRSDGSDSMGIKYLYALTARKELDRFLYYINFMDNDQLTFHSGSSETEFKIVVMIWNARNHELHSKRAC